MEVLEKQPEPVTPDVVKAEKPAPKWVNIWMLKKRLWNKVLRIYEGPGEAKGAKTYPTKETAENYALKELEKLKNIPGSPYAEGAVHWLRAEPANDA